VGVGVGGFAEDVQEFGSSPVVKKFAKAFDLEGKSSAEGREGSCQPVLRTLARNREELLKLSVWTWEVADLGAPKGEHGGDASRSGAWVEPQGAVAVSMEVASELLENM